jgi:hypothetical protein
LKGHRPHAACELLEAWIRNNDLRLYRNGSVVDPTELRDGGFYVRPRQAADARWTCTMATNAPQRMRVDRFYEDEDGTQRVVIVPPPESLWEVERSEVEALGEQSLPAIPNADQATEMADDQRLPDRRGRLLKYDWHAICGEIARRCINPKTGHVEVPKVESKLIDAMLLWCQERWPKRKEPPRSEMAEAVKRVCAALRTAQK